MAITLGPIFQRSPSAGAPSPQSLRLALPILGTARTVDNRQEEVLKAIAAAVSDKDPASALGTAGTEKLLPGQAITSLNLSDAQYQKAQLLVSKVTLAQA